MKRKNPKQPRADASDSEPSVKRRKHSLPSDGTTTEPIVIDTDDDSDESVEHDKVASISDAILDLCKNLKPVSREHSTTSEQRVSEDDQNDTGVPSSQELQQLSLQHNEEIFAQYAQSKRKVSKLEAELVEQRAFTERAQNRVKQDMMMDIMREKEKLHKSEVAASLAKRRLEKEVSEYKVKLEKAVQDGVMDRNQILSAQRAAESYRQETEHLQDFNVTLQSDLRDLRVVDAEDRRARNDGRRDLPPAYGNLDDEDRFPPYSQQADAGSIELANLKREIRRKFEMKVERALAHPGKGSNTFFYLSDALKDVSQSLHTILEFAKDVPVSHAHAQINGSITPHLPGIDLSDPNVLTPTTGRLPSRRSAFAGAPIVTPDIRNEKPATDKRKLRKANKAAKLTVTVTLIQNANAAPYVADRIAKLLLDLLWRTVSACELRRPRQRALCAHMLGPTLPVMYTSVDEVLVAALRLAFSRSHSLAAFQCYLTQVDILAKKFETLGLTMTTDHSVPNALINFEFFAKTLLWLNEQVEKERELRANEARALGAESVGIEDDDGVSSRWEGSDTASSDSEESDDGDD